jgi:hypothetical protein
MSPTRRELLAGAGAGLAGGLAGCTGVLDGGVTTFGATGVTLPASVQEETGYTHNRTIEDVISREFERFGLSRTVEVTNIVSEYDRAIELGFLGTRIQAAVFATLSTPQVSVFGRSFNPIAEMSAEEIAALVQDRYDNVGGLELDGELEATVTGETTTVTRFAGQARLVELGQGVDIYLYVSDAVEVGEDFVVTLAAHPQAFGERLDTVRTLLAGVEPRAEP